ncbi:urokinase plasminogen activator surface receptor isoform X1 [Gorilla gorilla gorilla]|uniref:urokinase plasminogen activator surface receptor isoform X1 n=1 Tax=Gorilla gorilla gorilla TaxID=9595 RepID=UPI0024464022|nr:urokinase plasminogen activator surface receptor isoform X1 [Gorilla gorilla gorilla]
MKGKTGQGRTLGKDLWAGIERSVSGVEAERGQRTDWKYRRPEPSRTWNTNLNGRGLETWSSWGLRCMQCKTNGDCRVEECALGQDLCRTTIVRMWEEGEELELVEKSCTHSEKTNRTLSYRTGLKITSLTEVVCGLDLCNQGNSGRAVTYSRSRYLECISCGSSDMSCERGRHQSLQCRSPEEQCLDVVTHWMQEGEEGRPKDDRHLRGCGYLPGCPGSNGFHSNDTFHFLKCCNTTKCNEGPILELENLPQNGRQCYSCKGNSTHGCSSEETFLIDCRGPMNQCLVATGTHELKNQSYMVRGCATASMCQHAHLGDAFSMNHIDVSCCTKSGCNHPDLDVQYRRGAAPQPGPAHLSLTITLLMTARLWGGTLLWT